MKFLAEIVVLTLMVGCMICGAALFSLGWFFGRQDRERDRLMRDVVQRSDKGGDD